MSQPAGLFGGDIYAPATSQTEKKKVLEKNKRGWTEKGFSAY